LISTSIAIVAASITIVATSTATATSTSTRLNTICSQHQVLVYIRSVRSKGRGPIRDEGPELAGSPTIARLGNLPTANILSG
jgi:hypothetical protein